MTAFPRPDTADGDLPCRGDHDPRTDRDRVHLRAHLRHLATVLTISGSIDASNTDRVSAYAARLIPVGNALLLDLSGVDFLAAQSVSVLANVGNASDDAGLPWALITSHAVDRVLRISEHDDILPVASSVPDGMRYFADLSRVRQQVSLSETPKTSGDRSMPLGPLVDSRRSAAISRLLCS